MLVLVLILVVIALALVLAAFFLHLVVLAWTSVGISLLAFLVLSYDWWQTKSAVRAGRQTGAGARDDGGDRLGSGGATAGAVGAGAVGAGALGAGAYGSSGSGDADMEPATQVLPIIPPQSNAAEETIVMPVVAPSGESEAPSGASRSGGLSSRNATMITPDDSASEGPSADGTTAVDPAAGPEPGSGGDPATGTAASDGGRKTGSDDGEADRSAGAGATVVAGTAAAGSAAAAAAVAGSGRQGDADPTRATSGAASGVTSEPTSEPVRGADATRTTDAGRTTAVPTGGSGPAGEAAGTVVGAAAAGQPPAEQAPAQQAPAQQATQQLDTSGEAPEEPRDPTLASLVARLPDEVVVIDERPRYHVQGCPSLPGQSVIPLPVSEAVELGFTPCGWCTPNRALGERHPAEVR